MRKYYGKCGQITHHQIILPTQIFPEVLKTLHGATAKYPGVTKMIQEGRAKYYYPGLAKLIKKLVTTCQECIKYKRINTRQTRPKMINPTDFPMGSEYILEIDVLPNLPRSAGYQHIITMIDVFSRYLFAYQTQNMTAQTVGKCIIDVMTRHAYLSTTMISEKGSQFTAEVVQEITKILDIEIRHATTKHAQTIGILEKTHASIKTSLKISTGERKSMWHKYVQIAVINHNTTSLESIGCEPSTVFHERISYNALDLKLGIKPQWQQQCSTELADQLQKQLNEMQNVVGENLMLSYIKYKRYYDRKADATPLKVNEDRYVLNPKADNQSIKFSFNECIWTGPYVIVKILSKNNCTIRELGTRYTQTLHRIRQRINKPVRCLPDVTVKQTDYLPDPDVLLQHNE